MKKKILIIFLVIILSFALGLAIHTIQIKKQLTTFIGVVEEIKENTIFVYSQDENLRNNYESLYFEIDENSDNTLNIGDKLEITFNKKHISESGFISNPTLTYLGKGRLFINKSGIPVSDSGNLGGNYVFKSFYDYNTSLNLNDFNQKEAFYLKKIVSYEEYIEYQKIIPEIRTLTEDDFINYYLIILLSTKTDNVYTLESPNEALDSLTLNIFEHKSLSKPETDTDPIYSGVSIVVPNRCDFNIENINLITKSTSN